MPFTPLDRTGWTATADSTFSTFVAGNAIDANTTTFWVSASGYPHHLIVDMGSAQTFTEVQYSSRQDGGNNPTSVELYVSDDGTTWGSAIATATWPATTATQSITFASVTKRYYKILATAGSDGFMSCAEVNGGGEAEEPEAEPKLLFIDSFDHWSAPQILRKWTQLGLSGTPGAIVPGRTGNGYTAAALGFPSKTFNAEYATLTAGVAYKTQAFSNAIIMLSNVTNGVLFSLGHVGDGRLKLTFTATGGSGASSLSTFVISLNTWYYFEVQAQITAASPPHVVATARVNGVEILSWDYTHAPLAGMKFATVAIQGPGGGDAATVDDFYCTTTEFLGDVKIGVLYPNATGDSAAWTPNAAGANWTKVKEHPADDDTTYVSAATVALKDLYNLDDIDPAFTGVIKGAQALWCVKKSDEGAAAVKGLWKSGATELTQADGHNYLAPNGYHPSAVDYLYNIQTERVSLFTTVDWTAAEINALQLGITRTL